MGVGTRVDWPGSAMTARGNEGVAGLITITENAIGYVEYGFAQRLGLKMAVLENRDSAFIPPSLAAGQQAIASVGGDATADLVQLTADPGGAGSYPLVTFTWTLVNERYADQRKGAAVRAFVGWGLSAGQDLSEGLGYVRLPEALAAMSQASARRDAMTVDLPQAARRRGAGHRPPGRGRGRLGHHGGQARGR